MTPTPQPTYSDAFLDKHRDINTYAVDWWEDVYANFKSDMESYGIYVERMYFSGFWSQGDGACFEGYIDDVPKFLSTHGLNYPALSVMYQHTDARLHISWTHRGRYYNERSLSYSTELDSIYWLESDDPDEDDLRIAALRLLLADLQPEYESLVDSVEFCVQDHCHTLYASLEAKYEDLTCNEAVAQALQDYGIEEDIHEQQCSPHEFS